MDDAQHAAFPGGRGIQKTVVHFNFQVTDRVAVKKQGHFP
jgi:hypothetical protein